MKLRGKYRFSESLLFSVQSRFQYASCHAMAVFHLLQQVAKRFCGSQGDVTAQIRINSIPKRKLSKRSLSIINAKGSGTNTNCHQDIFLTKLIRKAVGEVKNRWHKGV